MEQPTAITSRFLKFAIGMPLHAEHGKLVQLLHSFESFIALPSDMRTSAVADQQKRNQIEVFTVSNDSLVVSVGSGPRALESAPKGSVAVVPFRGAMIRESRCGLETGYIAGTRDLENTIKNLDAAQNFDAIVLSIKSPGGEASGNESILNTIRSCSKPVLVSFEGMASAAVYAFIGADEVYAVEQDSYFGSIGTMATLVDATGVYEELGFKVITTYAPQSTEKNKSYRAALEGDLEPLQEELRKSTEFFISSVKKARPGIKNDGKIFKGKIYNAREALKMNAIDGIRSLDWVINRAATLGRKYRREEKKRNSTTKNNQSIIMAEDTKLDDFTQEEKSGVQKFFSMFNPFSGSAKKEENEQPTLEEQLTAAQKQIATLQTQNATLQTQSTTASTEKTQLEADLKKAQDELANEQANHQKTQDELKTLQADMENLEKVELAEGEEKPKTVAALVEMTNKTLKHNQELGGENPENKTPAPAQEQTHVQRGYNRKKGQSAEQRFQELKQKEADRKKKKEGK